MVSFLNLTFTQINMKKTQIVTLLVTLLSLNIQAQNNISTIVEVNYNSFSHIDLKGFQQQLRNDINEVNLEVNDDFGANIGYSIGVKIENISTQIFASYNSTGGKISYSDFSGLIRLTQLLKAYTLGGEYQFKLSQNNSKDMFYLGARGFANYTQLDLDSYSRISESVSNESLKFNSIDFGIGIRIIYDISIVMVKLRLNLGYDFMLGGQLKFKENSDFYLEDDQGVAIKPGWSGFRSGIAIVIPL